MTIDIYTTPQCGFCKQLKFLLNAEGRTYMTHDVTISEEDLQEMKALTDGAMSVPVLVLDKGKDTQRVGVGFEEARKLLGKKEEKTPTVQRQTATLTCPGCGHQQRGTIPTTSCVPFYVCDGCKKTIRAAGKDCCVFCSYADRPCPMKSSGKDRGCEDGTCSIRSPHRP